MDSAIWQYMRARKSVAAGGADPEGAKGRWRRKFRLVLGLDPAPGVGQCRRRRGPPTLAERVGDGPRAGRGYGNETATDSSIPRATRVRDLLSQLSAVERT
jgi:hypothetical protein